MSTLVPCIIAGGAGTRLWPVSREAMPKPFMCLPDGQSLLQKTFARATGLRDVGPLLTVTNREVFFRTLDDYRAQSMDDIELDFILEPFGRNTAPAIAAAALQIAQRYGGDTQTGRRGLAGDLWHTANPGRNRLWLYRKRPEAEPGWL